MKNKEDGERGNRDVEVREGTGGEWIGADGRRGFVCACDRKQG